MSGPGCGVVTVIGDRSVESLDCVARARKVREMVGDPTTESTGVSQLTKFFCFFLFTKRRFFPIFIHLMLWQ